MTSASRRSATAGSPTISSASPPRRSSRTSAPATAERAKFQQVTSTAGSSENLFTRASGWTAERCWPGPRSPAKAVRLELNAGSRGEVVGDGAGVAGHDGRGGVDLLDEQGQG